MNRTGSVGRIGSSHARLGAVKAGCVGCLVIVALVLAGLIGFGVYASQHWREWTADWSERIVAKGIEEFDLPEEQRTLIMAEFRKAIDRALGRSEAPEENEAAEPSEPREGGGEGG